MKESITKRCEYSRDPKELEKQLAEHPYTAYAKEQRQKLEQDRYFPRYHFSAPEGKMNDPNGLCYWKGNWHLFYQAFPPGEDIRWGHAISDDLINWCDLPYAIQPEGEETACWSGSTLVEEDRVIACYLGYGRGNIIAVSDDPLLMNWKKIACIPVGFHPDCIIYDPCIYKEGEYYYSLSGATYHPEYGGREIRSEYLMRSKDLINWEYLHRMIDGGYACVPGDDGACPYFWPLGDKHLLIHYSHVSGPKYLIGKYDTEKQKLYGIRGGSFNTDATSGADNGGTHAPSAAPNGDGTVTAVFNYKPALLDGTFGQVVSLPRRFELGGPQNDELLTTPAPDMSKVYKENVHLENVAMPAHKEVVLEGIEGNCMELQLDFAPADTFPTLEIKVLRSKNSEEFTRICVYRQRGITNRDNFEELGGYDGSAFNTVVTLENTDSSLLPTAKSRAPETKDLFISPKDPVSLRIFIDKSIVEVFVNGGPCLAVRAYPSRSDSIGVSVCAKEKGTTLLRADAWQI